MIILLTIVLKMTLKHKRKFTNASKILSVETVRLFFTWQMTFTGTGLADSKRKPNVLCTTFQIKFNILQSIE